MAGSSPEFVKGHGTGNDFILLADVGGRLTLTERQVQRMCDRRFGIGADGILRVVPSAQMDLPASMTGGSKWFMDYRNSDGSLAEMCGNGARVFAYYLHERGLESARQFEFGTRGGVRRADVRSRQEVAVTMGGATAIGHTDGVVVQLPGRGEWAATGVAVPNPHAVAFLGADDPVAELGPIETSRAAPAELFPDGVNVEFVNVLSPQELLMRVNERGVGETMSCGTGACAVAWAHRSVHGVPDSDITVRVPGGVVRVSVADDDQLTLTGPVEIVAAGQFENGWWRS